MHSGCNLFIYLLFIQQIFFELLVLHKRELPYDKELNKLYSNSNSCVQYSVFRSYMWLLEREVFVASIVWGNDGSTQAAFYEVFLFSYFSLKEYCHFLSFLGQIWAVSGLAGNNCSLTTSFFLKLVFWCFGIYMGAWAGHFCFTGSSFTHSF